MVELAADTHTYPLETINHIFYCHYKLALNRISHHVVCIWNDNLFVDDYRRLVEG